MMAFLFLICVLLSVGGGVILAKKWQSDFGDGWPVALGIGILGFLVSGGLLGLAFLLGFIFVTLA